jgi:hypothetical protein
MINTNDIREEAERIKMINIFLFFLVILSCVYSCKDSRKKDDIAKVVNEWTGKEIRFPENVSCYVSGKDTLLEFCNECFRKEFKILLYVDSAGCSNCRLKLREWKQLMEEADSLFQGKVGFLLFFQPKSVKEMEYLFIRDRFDYPVFMDTNGTVNNLNRFPQAMLFQCFLLDSDNKVLMIGNPVSNPKIWELYKEQIAGEKGINQVNLTTVKVDKTVHDFGTIKKNSANPAAFTITNTGDFPLIIHRVSASCGCTNVDWEKQPIEPGQTTTIHVEMRPDETGYFNKTIEIYCNANESPVRLTLTGTTKK